MKMSAKKTQAPRNKNHKRDLEPKRRERQREDQIDPRMERLRSRKAEVQGNIDERKAAARFDPQPDAPAGAPPASARSLDQVLGDVTGSGGAAPPPVPKAPGQGLTPGQAETDNSYTARLLDAKKKSGAKKPTDGSAS